MCVCVLRALCFLSVKQYRDAVRDCTEALRMDGSNVKALYRRAQAHRELKVRRVVLQVVLCSESPPGGAVFTGCPGGLHRVPSVDLKSLNI